MINVKLDENKYFTGSYAKVGKVAGGINVPSLPPDMSKATCYKWDEREINQPIYVPVLDEETGEQKVDENGELVFEMQDNITYVMDWIFDEEKFNQEQIIKDVEEIRQKREEAFRLIDKYQLVLYYNDLTEEQKTQLADYRKSWLDAPATGVVPINLEWVI